MGIPSRPVLLFEGESCIVSGHQLAHKSCTSYSYAMQIRRSTLGAKTPSGCTVRALTGDVVNGTTIPQNDAVAVAHYGVKSEVRVGSNVCSPTYAAGRLLQGRAVVAQGNAGALVGTPMRSTAGPVNHCVLWNEGRGWHNDGHGHMIPTDVLVFDPEANGRPSSWGHVAQGPQWWPWSLCLKFVAALRPWGDGDPRTLGPGKMYCSIGPDTEPHVHLHYAGSVRTTPFPRTMVVHSPTAGRKVNVRSGPTTKYAVGSTLPSGATFVAYQQNPNGQKLAGSSLWFGDHNGTRWVHSSGVK